jgi:hypothetical protein
MKNEGMPIHLLSEDLSVNTRGWHHAVTHTCSVPAHVYSINPVLTLLPSQAAAPMHTTYAQTKNKHELRCQELNSLHGASLVMVLTYALPCATSSAALARGTWTV